MVPYHPRRAVPIYKFILPADIGGQNGFFMLLRLRLNPARQKLRQGTAQQFGPFMGQLIEENPGIVRIFNGDRYTGDHIPRIHPLRHVYEGHACFRFPSHHCMVDGSAASVFGQQGGVDINTAVPWQLQHRLGQKLPEGGGHDQIGLVFGYVPDGLLAPHPFRLVNRDAGAESLLLHRRRRQNPLAALGPVRLGDGKHHLVSFLQQDLQGGNGKIRGAHKYDAESILHALSSSGSGRYTRSATSRNRTPFRWSTSCWMQRASRSSPSISISWPLRSQPLTVHFWARRTSP
ncbi:hypothetical protein D3C75_628240 [compost metagenome]